MSSTAAPSPEAIRVRRAVSIMLSSLTIVASILVLAVQTLLPGTDPAGAGAASALMRLFERSSSYWLIPPVVALLLIGRLPRQSDLHILPAAFGAVALGLVALCHLMPAIISGEPLPFPLSP
ncbi:hypothetical protein [Microbacterium sp. LWH12-1.2]|uniref:hypothetical protein n=1 Tax=Microbacterium sp. LWH12-1.2 TaxID=3135259 RepID=UPI00344563A6